MHAGNGCKHLLTTSTHTRLKGRRVPPAICNQTRTCPLSHNDACNKHTKGVHKQWHHHRQAQQQFRQQGELLKPAAASMKKGLRRAALRCRQGVQAATISTTKQFLAHNSSTSMLSHSCERHGNTLCQVCELTLLLSGLRLS